MQINISARHGHLSDATQAKIAARVEKLLRVFERLTTVEVTVDLERPDSPSIDLRVSAEHKHDFVAVDQSDNLMGSIDNAIHKLEQQLRKYKEKARDKHRVPGVRQAEAPVQPGSETESE
ncbi:MAG: ribosome hibernation-promoting factor, HPF/YfiA family [Pirellulales bacterium]